ncbi:hypothetical protein JOQ06_012822 [Pogonophryne albipinna]|uniref:Transposase Tc1-like domain-containing protein n=1 Tax=Pogonophryne albipinna TaxID=1090488 RepID=A0AAD6BG26_9TELE|nr:hypothetical protein JOQ06_012373 [Pogonophryne albipinna]KAJ4944277.1 hypothetical protein JOQ06_012822 [Pogonophryne albipinna]
MITRTVSKNPRTTRGDLVNDLQRAGTKVTKATISNTLRRQGLKSCSARRVPLLKPVHVQTRLKFAREHLDDPEEDWENVICSLAICARRLETALTYTARQLHHSHPDGAESGLSGVRSPALWQRTTLLSTAGDP